MPPLPGTPFARRERTHPSPGSSKRLAAVVLGGRRGRWRAVAVARATRAHVRTGELVLVDDAVIVVVEALDQAVEPAGELVESDLAVAVAVECLEGAHHRLVHLVVEQDLVLAERQHAVAV